LKRPFAERTVDLKMGGNEDKDDDGELGRGVIEFVFCENIIDGMGILLFNNDKIVNKNIP
jgi:hypothetical protein